jgi:hypothetical protein
MSTSTFTVSYTHTVTYVSVKMLLTLKEIIREIDLDPSRFSDSWGLYERALTTWLGSRDLLGVALEVYNPLTNGLVTRWDIDVLYTSVGEGALWVDTAAVRYAIAKAGLAPSSCRYDLIFRTTRARPDVAGFSSCEFRSTDGFRRYAIGTTIGGNGITAQAAYWSR